MIAKYELKNFDFQKFIDFDRELVDAHKLGEVRFYPRQGVELFDKYQLEHVAPNWSVDDERGFLFVWKKNREIVRVVDFEQFNQSGLPKIKMTIDLNQKMISINEAQNISKEKIEESVKKFFEIKKISESLSVWWKYTHPVWWILQITKLPFFLIKKAGFNIGKIENSIFGKIVRWIIGAVMVFGGAILPILDAFGYKDDFVNFVKNIF